MRRATLVGLFAGDAAHEKLPATSRSTDTESVAVGLCKRDDWIIFFTRVVCSFSVSASLFRSVLPFVSALCSFRLFCDESVLLSLDGGRKAKKRCNNEQRGFDAASS